MAVAVFFCFFFRSQQLESSTITISNFKKKFVFCAVDMDNTLGITKKFLAEATRLRLQFCESKGTKT